MSYRNFFAIAIIAIFAVFSFAWFVSARAEEPAGGAPAESVHLAAAAAMPTLDVGIEPAFSGREFDRPVLVTHAGDGMQRLFVVEQKGRILVFDNEDQTDEPYAMFDIRPRVRYSDRQNEEGLLGLAFHPKYRSNRQLFVCYSKQTDQAERPALSVVARFTVQEGTPLQVDLDSEEILLTVDQPYWNHAGGTIVFGPDGYLYIAFGDGGSGGDPHKNGQNLGTLLGSVLRIDIDRQEGGRAYAIPNDNPFVGKKNTRPEIFAYGLRNVWRMAFDRKTGLLWAGDVGQDTWEEIDIIRNGGNYGWNLREGKQAFGDKGADRRADLVEPIWEYHHDVGKSITGGAVYRGRQIPELVGKYVYADYVSGQIWALDYDTAAGKVRANYRIPSPHHPIMSFGEDANGEIVFTTSFGKIYRFISAK